MIQQAGVLVLASASPRRSELLRQLAVRFVVQSSDIPEIPGPDEGAAEFAGRAAREKALAVAEARPRDWVLGADTVVVCDDEILGKPRDSDDACRMLARLSGRAHQVITAVALVAPGGAACDQVVVETEVEFRRLSTEEIQQYVASGEPQDKAGAYAIQGGASGFATHVRGSRTNVIGLPLAEVEDLLDARRLLDRRRVAAR